MGKSTLVYNLIGRPSQVQIDGTDPQGVTKTFSPFFANLRGTARKNDKIIDTPGIGDQTVRLVEWVTMAEKAFSQVNAIVCCVSETNPRITLGAELVTQMINKGFLGDVDAARNDPEKFELLCNAVVLVGTKGNLAGRKSRKAMAKETANQFAKRCKLPWVKYVAVDAGDWEEGTDNEDETPPLVLDPLQKHLAFLKEMIDDLERKGKNQKDVMKYTQIQKEDMINMCCNAMGVEVNDEDRRKMAHDLEWEREWVHGSVTTRAKWVMCNLHNGVVIRYSVGGIGNLYRNGFAVGVGSVLALTGLWYSNQESLVKNLDLEDADLIVTGEL